MSLKYRNSQGNETPVAGLNGTSGELVPSVALKQSGVINVEVTEINVLVEKTVTLSSSMPDTNYEVIITPPNVPNGTWAVSNKTTTGFIFTFLKTAGNTGNVAFNYSAVKLMTNEDRALDEARIEQNTTNFASAFSEVASYAVGDYVTYNGLLYRCTTAHTAGVWVAGHFTQVTVGSQLKVQDISSSITMEDGYASGQILAFRDGNTVQVVFNSVITTGYSKAICSGLPKPLHSGYFCVQGDGDPPALGLAHFNIDGTINSGSSTAGMAASAVWDGFITYLTNE